MNQETLLLGLVSLTLVSYALSLVYVVGIVWRVELQLDRSYKFFAFAVAFLLFGEIIDVYPKTGDLEWWMLALKVTRFVAALLLFFGMHYMRDLVRKIDGEKKPENLS